MMLWRKKQELPTVAVIAASAGDSILINKGGKKPVVL